MVEHPGMGNGRRGKDVLSVVGNGILW